MYFFLQFSQKNLQATSLIVVEETAATKSSDTDGKCSLSSVLDCLTKLFLSLTNHESHIRKLDTPNPSYSLKHTRRKGVHYTMLWPHPGFRGKPDTVKLLVVRDFLRTVSNFTSFIHSGMQGLKQCGFIVLWKTTDKGLKGGRVDGSEFKSFSLYSLWVFLTPGRASQQWKCVAGEALFMASRKKQASCAELPSITSDSIPASSLGHGTIYCQSYYSNWSLITSGNTLIGVPRGAFR